MAVKIFNEQYLEAVWHPRMNYAKQDPITQFVSLPFQ